jgi:hypothetical protein
MIISSYGVLSVFNAMFFMLSPRCGCRKDKSNRLAVTREANTTKNIFLQMRFLFYCMLAISFLACQQKAIVPSVPAYLKTENRFLLFSPSKQLPFGMVYIPKNGTDINSWSRKVSYVDNHEDKCYYFIGGLISNKKETKKSLSNSLTNNYNLKSFIIFHKTHTHQDTGSLESLLNGELEQEIQGDGKLQIEDRKIINKSTEMVNGRQFAIIYMQGKRLLATARNNGEALEEEPNDCFRMLAVTKIEDTYVYINKHARNPKRNYTSPMRDFFSQINQKIFKLSDQNLQLNPAILSGLNADLEELGMFIFE